MKLPNGQQALVDIRKIGDYCLSETHPRGKYRARVFRSVLGLTSAEAYELRAALTRAALEGEAHARESDEYGIRYSVDFEFARAGRRGTVRSLWIVRAGVPRLTSCFVL